MSYRVNEMRVPETTSDLEEHVMVSWLARTKDTTSDIHIVSGTQSQTGTFSSTDGAAAGGDVSSVSGSRVW